MVEKLPSFLLEFVPKLSLRLTEAEKKKSIKCSPSSAWSPERAYTRAALYATQTLFYINL